MADGVRVDDGGVGAAVLAAANAKADRAMGGVCAARQLSRFRPDADGTVWRSSCANFTHGLNFQPRDTAHLTVGGKAQFGVGDNRSHGQNWTLL